MIADRDRKRRKVGPGRWPSAILGGALLILPVACERSGTPSQPEPLGPEVAARVASWTIAADTVAGIAREQGLTYPAALAAAIEDALLAAWGAQRLGASSVRAAERASGARALTEELARSASAAGPPTDAELEEVTRARWWELDRPEMVRTTHAVVITRRASDDALAEKVAERILESVQGASTPAEFRRLASATASDGFEVRVEDLAPVTADGRAVDPAVPHAPGTPEEHYAEAYVRAAFAIPAVGRTSGVVRTEFGHHVILAVERLPELRIPIEERRRLLEPEIRTRRARRMLDELRAAARRGTAIEVDRSAMELTEKVRVTE